MIFFKSILVIKYAPLTQQGRLIVIIWHIQKVEPSSPYPPCRAWTPRNTDMEIKQAPLGSIS